jgi:hypothetical protein
MEICEICGKVLNDIEYNYISVKEGSQYIVCTACLEMLLDALAEIENPN